MTVFEIKEKLKTMIPDRRYEHTLGVEYTACCMAYRYGADPAKTRIAALLHDCAKYIPARQKISECQAAGYQPNEAEMKNPELLHSRLGAIYARDKFGIEDEEILSAITWHTTGKPEMSLLDKIIYIADYIEPNRDRSPILGDVRALAFRDIDQCLVAIMRGMMDYLSGSSSVVDPMTRSAFEYYDNQH